jgi:hypothetical protein
VRPECWKNCTKECELVVHCTVCRKRKAPRGRSAPMEMRCCDYDCPGWAIDPQPGHLWPGELEEMDREPGDES